MPAALPSIPRGISIGASSRLTGVKVQTIRFYETHRLMLDPGRTEGVQRRYGDTQIDRLSFIAHAWQLGFDLGSIAELIALQDEPLTAHGDAH